MSPRTLPVTPAERACATVLRAWLEWHETPPEPRSEVFEAMLNLGDWLADNGIVEGECLSLTPAGAAILARVEAAERTPKEAEKNRAEAERMETFEAAIRDAAKKGGPYCATHAREAVAALDAARLAGTTPIDAPPAKEPAR